MKTEQNLLELIDQEVAANEGKAVKYEFLVDVRAKMLSMRRLVKEGIGWAPEVIIDRMPFVTESQVQQAYWTIWNNGRIGEQTKWL